MSQQQSRVARVRRPADQICQGCRVVPPRLTRPVTVIDYWDNGGSAAGSVEVAYQASRGGHGTFIICRYDDLEFVPTYPDRHASVPRTGAGS